MRASLRDAFHRPETGIFRVVESVVWLLIIVSVALFVAELLLPAYATQIGWADRIILSLFGLELLLRLLTYRAPMLQLYRGSTAWRLRIHVTSRLRFLLRPLQLIDLLTVLALVPTLRMLRALRLLRLLRTSRVFRYASPVQDLVRTFSENSLLHQLAFSLLLLAVIVGGLTIYLAEGTVNAQLGSVGDGIWWALVTITTVGYGDITPVSTVGKVAGGAMMVIGMFTLALFAGIVGSTLLGVVLRLRQEQFRMSTRANHVVICGYDAGSRLLHATLIEEFHGQETELVVFAEGERPASLPPDFTWIDGDPTKESELDKARVQDASAVLVVGSREVSSQLADARTILVVFTIRSYIGKHPAARQRLQPLYVIAEVLDAENVEHARAAEADEVIGTTQLGFSVMAHSLVVPGAGEIMTSVALSGAHNLYIGKNPFDETMAYGDLIRAVKDRFQATVLGVREMGGQVTLGPDDTTPVPRDRGIIHLARGPVLETVDATTRS